MANTFKGSPAPYSWYHKFILSLGLFLLGGDSPHFFFIKHGIYKNIVKKIAYIPNARYSPPPPLTDYFLFYFYVANL